MHRVRWSRQTVESVHGCYGRRQSRSDGDGDSLTQSLRAFVSQALEHVLEPALVLFSAGQVFHARLLLPASSNSAASRCIDAMIC